MPHGTLCRKSFLLAFFLLFAKSATAGLLLDTHKILLDERNPSASVYLFNNSGNRTSYKIVWAEFRQTNNGTYRTVQTAGQVKEHPLLEALRYGPRRVTLDPGSGQTVRFSLRAMKLTRGEHRLHMHFIELPNPGNRETTEAMDQSTEAMDRSVGIRIRFTVGVSIPVIVRIGSPQATGQLTDLQLIERAGKNNDETRLYFTIRRQGDASLLGDVEAYVKAESVEKIVGLIRNINVFPEIRSRTEYLLLDDDAAGNSTSIYMVYTESITTKRTKNVIARAVWKRGAERNEEPTRR